MPYKDPQKQKEAKRRYYLKKKYNIESKLKAVEYPPIIIPKGMKETKYPGYFITENGKAFRSPGKCDTFEQYGKINEYGLIYLKPGLRGHSKHPKHRYECINISIRDENEKFIKQIGEYIHRLVAETFIENPNNLPEIDHIDRNKRNNHISNLEWCDRNHNMRWNGGEYKIIDTIHNKTYEGRNVQKFVRENWIWISQRTNIKIIKNYARQLVRKRKIDGLILQKYSYHI